MACLDMYNSEHKGPPMSPRISFSNDFVDTQQILKQSTTRESPPVSSSDFEFSVSNFSMMSADELFFKGRLLPFKDNNSHDNGGNQMQRTIRDELLHGDDDDNEVSLKPPKGSSSTRWKGLLGLKRSHIGSKKVDKATGCYVDRVAPESRRPNISKTSQDILGEGGSSCRDVEIGI